MRTVNIAKGEFRFAPVMYLEAALKNIAKMPRSTFDEGAFKHLNIARRLGHASMTTTQKTYLHIIQELENKDLDLVMRSLSSL